MTEIEIPITSKFLNATKGATLETTENIADSGTDDLEIDLAAGKELLLNGLYVDLDGCTIVSLKIDDVDLVINSGMINSTDKHIDFNQYYGMPVYVGEKIVLRLSNSSGSAADPVIVTRGMLIPATH